MPLGGVYDSTEQIHGIIELVNPVTMPRLQRLILDVRRCEFDFLSLLGEQLIQYDEGARSAHSGLQRVNISVSVPSKVSPYILPEDIFPFIDNFVFGDPVSGDPVMEEKSENLSLFESLRGLEKVKHRSV